MADSTGYRYYARKEEDDVKTLKHPMTNKNNHTMDRLLIRETKLPIVCVME